MQNVYIVHHSYPVDSDVSYDETKLIGVYSTRSEAESAIERLKLQPGFKSLPDYFSIDEYALNQDHWQEGFVSDYLIPIYSVWQEDESQAITLVKSGLVLDDALRIVRELNQSGKTKVWAREHH